jgi:hypothetical protein
LNIETNTIRDERLKISGYGDPSAILNFISHSLPPEVIFSAVSFDIKNIVVDGRAINRSEIISYARNLEKEGQFAEVRIAETAEITAQAPDNGEMVASSSENNPARVKFKIILDR